MTFLLYYGAGKKTMVHLVSSYMSHLSACTPSPGSYSCSSCAACILAGPCRGRGHRRDPGGSPSRGPSLYPDPSAYSDRHGGLHPSRPYDLAYLWPGEGSGL